MMGAISHSLPRLFDASGRDRRATFWWYMVAVQLLMALISFVAVLLLASGAESAADAKSMGGLWIGIASSLVMLVLVAASVVRRLHDSGLTGWIAALPGAFYLAAIARMPELARELESLPEGEMPSASTGDLLLDWLPTLIVIVIGVLPSSPGANRYGTEGE